MTTLLLYSSRATAAEDAHLAMLVEFLGCRVQTVDVGDGWATVARSKQTVSSSEGIAVHAGTLALLISEGAENAVSFIEKQSPASVFVYGFSPQVSASLLTQLTEGRITSVEPVRPSSPGEVTAESVQFSHQLAGAALPRAHCPSTGEGWGFSGIAAGSDVLRLVVSAQKPTSVYLKIRDCGLFLSTSETLPSPALEVQEEESIEAFYDALLPLLMFVRNVAGESCWHGAAKSARLIIDDPVLRPRYGYLDFRKLFDSMEKYRYSATVAYIPWNYKRTSAEQAAFFKAHSNMFSICLHGCDHMNNEYGTTDEAVLFHKSRLALERMTLHESRTGIPCEPVIVFPQGRFSSPSLRALRQTNYLGAINSTRFPMDGVTPPITLGDLLLPAIAGPEGFPVFPRHYPAEEFALRFSLFLGRPAFLVEHHEYFKAGLPELETLVQRMNRAEPALNWGTLAESVTTSGWQRRSESQSWEVRFFTDLFEITNTGQAGCSYVLWKEEPERSAKGRIRVGESELRMEYEGNRLRGEFVLAPRQSAQVTVTPFVSEAKKMPAEGIKYSSKVFIRRALSEFRDEVLVRNPAMLAPAKALVKMMKAGADSHPQRPRPLPARLGQVDATNQLTKMEK
jgi:hypothetical protein